MEGKIETLANDILEKCQKQGMTFQEMKILLIMMQQRVEEGRAAAMEEAGKYKLKFRAF